MSTYDYIRTLSSNIGDSFYIFKKEALVNNIMEFKGAFKEYYSNVNLGYSVKTNYIPRACQIAYNLGAYIEVVSEMELNIALKLNIPAKAIIYNGPIKSISSLKFCLLNDTKVNIDNLEELMDAVQIANKNPGSQCNIGFRINISLDDGFNSRFGFDTGSEEFEKAISLINNAENLHIIGLHTHSTRPDKSVDSYLHRLDKMFEVYKKWFSGMKLEYLDLGGGFYGKMDENIRSQFGIDHVVTFQEYGRAIGQRMKEYFPDGTTELILEPGLALTVNILDFVCKVVNIRTIGNKTYATVTGSFHNIKPSGHGKNLTVKHYSHSSDVRKGQVDIVGYTCLENDIIHRNFPYSLLAGDFLMFKNVGAYTLVFKPIFIKLSPAIISLSKDGYEIIKQQDNFDNYFNCYSF